MDSMDSSIASGGGVAPMISRGTNALGIKITLNSGRHKRGICLETIPKSDKTYETVSLTLNSLRTAKVL